MENSLPKNDASLAEARVIFELGHSGGMIASNLADMPGLDPGYLSRVYGVAGSFYRAEDEQAYGRSLTIRH